MPGLDRVRHARRQPDDLARGRLVRGPPDDHAGAALENKQQGVVRRFGRVVNDKVMPGIHYRLPWPFEKVDRPRTLQVKVMSVGFRMVDKVKGVSPLPEETQILTGDENIIDIQMIVQYRVENTRFYLFAVEKPSNSPRVLYCRVNYIT